ncbi:hypothetical protein Pfo_015195 [Paulownia fortunei]|nr:hypothetical protein Pfo_015195 [Paulownia fortunei]
MSTLCYFASVFCLLALVQNAASVDYGAALTKSLLFYEAQRSGKLPSTQRVKWRGDSALSDGKDAGVDLVGGYYDAGDNVKFGFPMAFTVTMLAWSVVEFGPQLRARNELLNALRAVKWGTDFLIKAHPEPNVLYAQRPEDMTTPRAVYKIDEQHPGSDLAGESAAALAAAAISFKGSNPGYSSRLLNHAKQATPLSLSLSLYIYIYIYLFDFATKYTGQYQNSIPAGQFYSSSGYEDELLWAAAWLARATNDNRYLDIITKSENSGGTRKMFSWDDKYVGAQVLISKSVLEGKISGNGNLDQLKNYAEQYICNCIQKGSNNVQRTSGGLLWFQEWNNLHYVTSATFIITAYADSLATTKNTLQCPGGAVRTEDLITFAQSQVDYILGSNPKQMSYMVGFGSTYPNKVHHRGASIVSIKKDPSPVTCQGGFGEWFNRDADNPNVLDGAIVGGPNQSDEMSTSSSPIYFNDLQVNQDYNEILGFGVANAVNSGSFSSMAMSSSPKSIHNSISPAFLPSINRN